MKSVKILDKKFHESIAASDIQKRITDLAATINTDFTGKEIDFVVVLNGAFMFAAELLKQIQLNCRVIFVKLASYEGVKNTGTIRQLIGLNESLAGRIVIVLEDIIDSGNTINHIIGQLSGQNASEIFIATLLFKSGVYQEQHKIHYFGFEIPNDFIIGYGLDYNGYGRNLDSIYTIIHE